MSPIINNIFLECLSAKMPNNGNMAKPKKLDIANIRNVLAILVLSSNHHIKAILAQPLPNIEINCPNLKI